MSAYVNERLNFLSCQIADSCYMFNNVMMALQIKTMLNFLTFDHILDMDWVLIKHSQSKSQGKHGTHDFMVQMNGVRAKEAVYSRVQAC